MYSTWSCMLMIQLCFVTWITMWMNMLLTMSFVRYLSGWEPIMFMVFHTSNRSVTYSVLQMDRRPIERVSQFNFLGLILRSNLAWSKHINHVSLKIFKTIGILYRLKAIYPSAVLQTVYNTLILPFFNYCILVWGATINDGNLLHRLQKKALRLISSSNYIAHTEPICKKLFLLN